MSSSDEAEQVVEHPTYMKDIRFYFTPRDVAHMAGLGIALGTYDDVKRRAVQIYFETKPPHGPMPARGATCRWHAAASGGRSGGGRRSSAQGRHVPQS